MDVDVEELIIRGSDLCFKRDKLRYLMKILLPRRLKQLHSSLLPFTLLTPLLSSVCPPRFHPRSTRDSETDEEDEERRVSRGCTLQYQRALVKVLTQFHTTSTEGTDQVITMLGPDWQVDVTDLVQDSLKVAEPRIAELVDRTVLVGLELGSTLLKVTSR